MLWEYNFWQSKVLRIKRNSIYICCMCFICYYFYFPIQVIIFSRNSSDIENYLISVMPSEKLLKTRRHVIWVWKFKYIHISGFSFCFSSLVVFHMVLWLYIFSSQTFLGLVYSKFNCYKNWSKTTLHFPYIGFIFFLRLSDE